MTRPIEFRLWGTGFTEVLYEVERRYKINEIRHLFMGGILMQFTGLLDRNGKKIFEGDILKTPEEDIHKVYYDCAMFLLDPGYDEENALWCIAHDSDCEVIGNIYETPELLK